MPAEHTYWKILKGKMKVTEMICLPALCNGPLKGKVIGFCDEVGVREEAWIHFGAALHPSGIVGQDDRSNDTHCLRGL